MAKKEMPGCTCCAEVVERYPSLKFRFKNQLILLKKKTALKKLPVLACPECDEPLIANANERAGKPVEDGPPGTDGKL